MVLILSIEGDASTDAVVDWLIHYNVQFTRINETTELKIGTITINNSSDSWEIILKDFDQSKVISGNDVKTYWYRRGEMQLKNNLSLLNTHREKPYLTPILNNLSYYLTSNQKDAVDFLHLQLKNIKHIGAFYENFTVKLFNQIVAQKVGFLVPDTLVCTDKNELQKFMIQHPNCISKGIKNNSFGIIGEIGIGCLTQMINKNDLENFSEKFTPSLFQAYIEKTIELRIFYLDGKCYSSAIFSQNDEKTKVDFRNYNNNRPNRLVPYQLPAEEEIKIINFMTQMDMKSGSIDVLLSTELKYYFLEVNPIGQYDWVSKSCNYMIDKVIADYLKN